MDRITSRAPRVRRGLLIITLVLVVLTLVSPTWGANLPCCPAGDLSVGVTRFHQIMVLQGDDPNTPEEEPRDRIHVIDRTYWSVPWNNSQVYTYIPPEARDISIDHVVPMEQEGRSVYVSGEFSVLSNPENPPETGWMTQGNYTAFYYWTFPEGAQRGRALELDVDSTVDFRQFDEDLTVAEDWDTSGGMLMLLPGTNTSTYVSRTESTGLELLTVDLTIEGTSTGSMTFEITVDNGTTWFPVTDDGPMEAPESGNEFKWRVTFDQDGSMAELPALERVTFDLLYTPEFNDMWLEASYTLDIPDEGVEFDFTLPFDGDGTGFIVYVYTDEDMPFSINGTDVEMTDDPEYEGKTVHRHLSGEYASLITMAMDVEEGGHDGTGPGGINPVLWVLVGLVVLLVALLGMGSLRGSGKRAVGPKEESDARD
ncbi:MAG: hypothetical protein JSW25_00310 [Thermoplasmata archaeon]|nr:MAG: hypothetical protein JSW25_00310 [Thermoplasmata archaeon]